MTNPQAATDQLTKLFVTARHNKLGARAKAVVVVSRPIFNAWWNTAAGTRGRSICERGPASGLRIVMRYVHPTEQHRRAAIRCAEVLIEEASPDATEFQEAIRAELERSGWPDVHVVTAW